jgi:hypothetical protein
MILLDLEATEPKFHWTFSELSDYEKEEGTNVWFSDPLKKPDIGNAQIAFDYPGYWDPSLDRMEFEQRGDGTLCWPGVRGWPGLYWGVKTETETHVFLIGEWKDEFNLPYVDRTCKGLFIAVFPKS